MNTEIKSISKSEKLEFKKQKIKEFLLSLPTLDSISKEAGIAVGVISRFVNDKKTLNESHIKRIIPVIKKHGYK